MAAKAAALSVGPALFLGGALFNVLPSPTDALYFIMLSWLQHATLPGWEAFLITVTGYYMLPGAWYLGLTLAFFYLGEEIEEKVAAVSVIFAAGMLVYLFFYFFYNTPGPVPDGNTIAGITLGIVGIFAVLALLATREVAGRLD